MRPLHIVFSGFAAEQLREGLVLAGRDEEVCGQDDNWALGPIDSEDLDARLDAVGKTLEIDIDAEERREIITFWQTALDATRPRIVWLSQWSTLEYCGFLEWLRRNADAPFLLVDLTDVAIPGRNDPQVQWPIQCTPLVDSKAFAENALWTLAIAPSPSRLRGWRSLWERLRAENAPLRVIAPGGLESAPIHYFDGEILKHATADWKFDRYIVGHVLADMMDESFREGGVYQCGDLILFARIRALVEQGRLEGLGNPYDSDFKVRLPHR